MRSNLLVLLVFAAACSGYSITGGPGRTVTPSLQSASPQAPGLVAINTVLLAPIDSSAEGARAHQELVRSFDRQLQEAVRREVNVELLLGEPKLPALAQGGEMNITAWLGEARRRGADGLWVTRLHTYQEREGSAVGANAGARVGFLMELYRAADGKELWRASYYFEDQALTDNLFRLPKNRREGADRGWVSAQSLLLNGFQEAARDFAAKRVTAFAGR